MAKKNGQDGDLDDPSLLEGETDDLNGDDTLEDNDLEAGDDLGEHVERDKGKKTEPPQDDFDIVVEEETEQDLDREADEGALDDGGRRNEDDLTDASRNVRERIERERRIAREATARANAAHAARLEAEAKSRAAQKEALEVTEGALDAQIKATRAQLVKAKEDGKSEDEVKLGEDLDRLNRRKDAVADAKKAVEQQEEEAKRGGGAAPQAFPLAEDWKRRNTWYGNARFREATAIARMIDAQLKNVEGYDPNSREYYEELDRRLRRRAPEIQRFQRRPAPQPQDRPRREPTGGTPRRDTSVVRNEAGRRVVKLTKADFENMQRFGLDPKDKEHQREYARQKMTGGK